MYLLTINVDGFFDFSFKETVILSRGKVRSPDWKGGAGNLGYMIRGNEEIGRVL